MKKPKYEPPKRLFIEGHNGGSFVQITCLDKEDPEYKEDVVWLEVGHSCVRTVNQKINVAALALILSEYFGKDYEHKFDAAMQEYGWQDQYDLFEPYKKPERKHRGVI